MLMFWEGPGNRIWSLLLFGVGGPVVKGCCMVLMPGCGPCENRELVDSGKFARPGEKGEVAAETAADVDSL